MAPHPADHNAAREEYSFADGAVWLDGHRFSAGASAEDVLAWENSLSLDIE